MKINGCTANGHCSESLDEVERRKNPARGTSHFVQCTARMPCRILAQQPRIFAKQKYGSERAVSKVGYFFDSLSSLKLSLYIAMT